MSKSELNTVLLYSTSKVSRSVVQKLIHEFPWLAIDFVETGEPARFRIPCLLDKSGVPWEGKDGVELFLSTLRRPDENKKS